MRLAIVSSPRTGNTWIRSTIANALGVPEIAVHDFRDATLLPEHVVLQLHWHREPKFQAWLAAKGFEVATIARHPLDVLLSAIRFALKEPQVARWLNGSTGLPIDVGPNGSASAAFVDYCLSDGSANLLSVMSQWWSSGRAKRLRYEDAVADPVAALLPLVQDLGGTKKSLLSAIENNPLEKLRATPNQHAWRGQPGHWRDLIATMDAARIYWRHRDTFNVLGYRPIPYIRTRSGARRRWEDIA